MRRTLLGDRLVLRAGSWGLDWHRRHPIEGRSGWTLWLHGVPVVAWVSLPVALRHAVRAWWSMRRPHGRR